MTRQEFADQTTLALDTDDDTQATAALRINGSRNAVMILEADTGAHTTHVVDLQFSADGLTWHDHATMTLTGLGTLFVEGTVNGKFVRAKVSTAEGGASTINVHIQVK